MNAMQAARQVATESFDEYLDALGSAAASSVPHCVEEKARRAYRDAGGIGDIVVRGRGNRTHPVCTVYVMKAK